MSLLQFSGLFVVWLLCTLFIATLTWFEFRRVRFNFNVFFSLLFLLTFFFGFPLTSVLVFRFDVGVAPPEILLQALLSAGCFYAVYYVTYKTRLRKRVADVPRRPLFTMNRVETNLTWVILMGIALVSVGIFFMHNGFLLFRLNSYSQIFSSEVSGVALKRFFYFFIPAMLVVYFLRLSHPRYLFAVGESGIAVAELRQHRLPGSGSHCPRFLCLYPFLAVAGSPEYGAELSQLLYLGSAE